MKNDDIKKIFEKYINRNKEINRLKEILTRLENFKIIKRYNEIKEILAREKELEENEILYKIFNFDVISKLNNNIYIYYGAYEYDRQYDSRSDFRCNEIENADYLLYKNLVNVLNHEQVLPRYYKEFEKNNIIIKLSDNYLVNKKYYELQRFYYKSLLKGLSEDEILIFLEENKNILGIKSISIPKKIDKKITLEKKMNN